MANTVILPKLGQTMEEGVIVEWLKQEGEDVQRGDVLFQVESDKAVLEVESRHKGVLLKILVGPNTRVPVLTPVAIIGDPGEDISALLDNEASSGERQEDSAGQPAPQAESAGEPEASTGADGGGRIFGSPRARRLAREEGVDLALLAGSGPQGRIVERDVKAYLAQQPTATPLAERLAKALDVALPQPRAGERVAAAQVQAMGTTTGNAASPALEQVAPLPLSGMRAIIAQRMGDSAHTTAAVTLQSQVDATELVTARERLKEAYASELGFGIGYNDLLAVIVSRCLREMPYMNVQLSEGGVRQMPSVNLGLAVDSPRGLLVPVIHEADRLSVRELAVRFRELVARAREGKALPDELSGGTFTITNLGMFGVDAFTPIINLPECAILGVGRIRPEPSVVNGQVVVRQSLWLSLTFDHRIVDGGPAARFLQAIGRYIEQPYLLLA